MTLRSTAMINFFCIEIKHTATGFSCQHRILCVNPALPLNYFLLHLLFFNIARKDAFVQRKNFRAEHGVVDMPDGHQKEDQHGFVRVDGLCGRDKLPGKVFRRSNRKPEDEPRNDLLDAAQEDKPIDEFFLVAVSAVRGRPVGQSEIVSDIMQGILGVLHGNEHGGLLLLKNYPGEIYEDVLQSERREKRAGGMVEKPRAVDPPEGADDGLGDAEGVELLRKAGHRQSDKERDQRQVLDDPVEAE